MFTLLSLSLILLLVLPSSSFTLPSNFPIKPPQTLKPTPPSTILHSTPNQTLFSLRIRPTSPSLKSSLISNLQSTPFSALLPVQPLTYSPTSDGVSLSFLRKKTEEKSSREGGIIFQVKDSESEDIPEEDNGTTDIEMRVVEVR